MLRKSVICALACAGQSTIAWFLVPVRPVALRGAEMLPFTQVDSNCTTQPRLLQTPQTLDALSKLWVLVYLSTTRDNVYEHWSAVQSSCGCLTASRCERTVKVLLALRKESKDSSKSLIGVTLMPSRAASCLCLSLLGRRTLGTDLSSSSLQKRAAAQLP